MIVGVRRVELSILEPDDLLGLLELCGNLLRVYIKPCKNQQNILWAAFLWVDMPEETGQTGTS